MNDIVSREKWLAARKELLLHEKAHTHARQALAEKRRDLPWVRVEKNYEFVGPNGTVTLPQLFGGSAQLVIYHLMFGPGWDAPCPGCAAWAYALNGTGYQFEKADALVMAISRAPYAQVAQCAKNFGWTFDWISSYESEFNYDFHASVETAKELSHKRIEGTDEIVDYMRGENHGVSVFIKKGDEVFHTYSSYNRGIEELNGAMGYLDILPGGRGGLSAGYSDD